MLPKSVRMRSGDDFTRTVRRGVRVGTETLVLHAWREPEADHGPLVGFVVSKGIGTAVVRNRVKRRLRHLVRDRVGELAPQLRIVVRALPAAADRAGRLPDDLGFAWSKALAKLDRRARPVGAGR